MCGIVGIFDTLGLTEINRNLVHKMNESQFHRGPDAGGLHIEPGLGFGHRRLSIIDRATGQQPMANENENVWVTFNGEIYNFPELTKQLTAAGYCFRTHSDTEVIIHAWEEWGENCVKHFHGMFAFAIWDRKKQTLFLARDRLGKKPLHYCLLNNGHFIFGSELKSLYTHPSLIKKIDPRAVEEYFAFGYVNDPRTIFENIFKLPPAHTLLIERGQDKFKPTEYWDIPFKPFSINSEKTIKKDLSKRLEKAVSDRMISEVPLGAFLSGGVDSSSVVAFMSKHSTTPVTTCSIAFENPKHNEAEFSAHVAKQFKTNHIVETVTQNDYELIDKLAEIYDEPYADSSAIPTYRVCELARKHVTVVLSGDGADEYFVGYHRHQNHMKNEKIRALLPRFIGKPVFSFLAKTYPTLEWAPRFLQYKKRFQALSQDSISAYMGTLSIFNDEMREKLFSDNFKESLNGYRAVDVFKHYANKSPAKDTVSVMQYIDLKTFLVSDINTKVDRASMANSLEVRAPFLDHELVEWGSKLPPNLKLRGNNGKYILKKTMENHLPEKILYRTKKGFTVPLADWFRGPLNQRIQTALLSDEMKESGYFNMDYIQELITTHQSGAHDHSGPIWALLMFNAFQKQMLKNST